MQWLQWARNWKLSFHSLGVCIPGWGWGHSCCPHDSPPQMLWRIGKMAPVSRVFLYRCSFSMSLFRFPHWEMESIPLPIEPSHVVQSVRVCISRFPLALGNFPSQLAGLWELHGSVNPIIPAESQPPCPEAVTKLTAWGSAAKTRNYSAEPSPNCWPAEIIKGYGFKPLSFGRFVMQQKLTDTFMF